MKLTIRSYGTIITIQIILLMVDICINSFLGYLKHHLLYQLALFLVQDICLILALTSMLLTFFSTHIFQAGLVELLYDRFRCTIIICMVYFILTTTLHIWSLTNKWKHPLEYNWSIYLHLLFILQRFTSAVYYYLYKRAALRISDPRFFEALHHVNRQGITVH